MKQTAKPLGSMTKSGGAQGGRGKKSVSKGRRQKEQPVVEVIPKKRIRVLSPEHRELKEVVDMEVKSPPPTNKRRTTMQNVSLIVPKEMQVKIEKEDHDEHVQLIKTVEERKTR